MDTQAFVRERFAEFYEGKAEHIEAPQSIEQREFGFLTFKENIMIRHKGFTTLGNLVSFVKQVVPAHAYYSTAYYEMPEEKMEDKGWLGADLYFDIDADHIPTNCGKIHDTWTCKNKDCGFEGRGIAPETCPMCSGKSFEERTWPCEVCLESAKLETMKLVDILTEEFGFSLTEVNLSFSGHRGYHVHVQNEAIRQLDSVARKEIVDYVTGVGLEPAFHGLEGSGTSRPRIVAGPGLNDVGWGSRIAKGTRELLSAATEEDLKSLGLRRRAVDEILGNRDPILRSWVKSGPWGMIRGLGADEWRAIVQRGVESQSVRIDTVVTTDIHRLIRLPGSLHGKTGLLKVSFSPADVEEFDPLKRAIAFEKGEAAVSVDQAPEFRLGEERFGPFRKQKVELPLAAALFLLCKGAAEVVG